LRGGAYNITGPPRTWDTAYLTMILLSLPFLGGGEGAEGALSLFFYPRPTGGLAGVFCVSSLLQIQV